MRFIGFWAINFIPSDRVFQMDSLQKKYAGFMESVCGSFNCKEAFPALMEGFSAYCRYNSLFEATLQNNCEECGHKIDDPHSCYCDECGAKLDDDLDVGDEKAARDYLLQDDPNPDKYCEKCGAPVEPDDRYCTACGEKLTDNARASINKQIAETFIANAKDAFKRFGPGGIKYGLKKNNFIAKISYSALLNALKEANGGKELEGLDKDMYVDGIHKAIKRIQDAVDDRGDTVKVINNDVYIIVPVKNFETTSLSKLTKALIDASIQGMTAEGGVDEAKWNRKHNVSVGEDEKEDYGRLQRAEEYVKKLYERAKQSHKTEDQEAAFDARKKFLSMKYEIQKKYLARRKEQAETLAQ